MANSYQMTDQQTLASVIQEACSLLSLPIPQDPAGSTDPNVLLLRTAANLASIELLNSYEWPNLTKVGAIDVFTEQPPLPNQSIETPFDLPADFFRFIDQTQWNGAMRFPAVGPVSPQGWMTYLVYPVTANFTLTWQMREGQIWFLNAPAFPGQTFKFMYISRALVQDADNPDLYKNIATKNGDKFILDGVLMMLLTRVKWIEARGFDSSSAMREFLLAYDTRVGATKGANVLNMAGRNGAFPLIGVGNLPVSSLYGMRM